MDAGRLFFCSGFFNNEHFQGCQLWGQPFVLVENHMGLQWNRDACDGKGNKLSAGQFILYGNLRKQRNSQSVFGALLDGIQTAKFQDGASGNAVRAEPLPEFHWITGFAFRQQQRLFGQGCNGQDGSPAERMIRGGNKNGAALKQDVLPDVWGSTFIVEAESGVNTVLYQPFGKISAIADLDTCTNAEK